MFPDADLDGFGDTHRGVTTCAPHPDWIDTAGDCDDSDVTVFPGAQEIFSNGIDEDCDGQDAGQTGDTGRPAVERPELFYRPACSAIRWQRWTLRRP